MKKSIKGLLVTVLSLSLLIGATGCGKNEKKQTELPTTTNQSVANEDVAKVPTKDDSGKELSEQQRTEIAAKEKESEQITNIANQMVGLLYNFTPENVEQQILKSNQYCMDTTYGLYGDKVPQMVKKIQSSNIKSVLVDWNVDEINFGETATFSLDKKTYKAAVVMGTAVYNDGNGQSTTEKVKFVFGLDEKSKSWKVLTYTFNK